MTQSVATAVAETVGTNPDDASSAPTLDGLVPDTKSFLVPLNRLVADPSKNVRIRRAKSGVMRGADGTVIGTKGDVAAMALSLAENGQLQPLSIRPILGEERTMYAVPDGETRRLAYLLMAKKGEVAEDHMVRVSLVEEERATRVSAASNIARRDMHPADYYESFVRQLGEGRTEADFAREYGLPKGEIRKILRLGNLDRYVLGDYRAGRIDQAAVRAFAEAGDKRAQRDVRAALGHLDEIKASDVTAYLDTTRYLSDGPLMSFVGLAAYRKAGGTVVSDLFGASYAVDRGVADQLASEALEKVAAGHVENGWAWVFAGTPEEAAAGPLAGTYRIVARSTEEAVIPDEVRERGEAVERRLDALDDEVLAGPGEEDASDEAVEDHDRRYRKAKEARSEHRADVQARFADFGPIVRAHGGVVVTFDAAGALQVREGIVKEADVADYVAAKTARATEASVESEKGKQSDAGEQPETSRATPAAERSGPSAAERDFGQVRRAVIRHALADTSTRAARKYAVATDLLHFDLVSKLFTQGFAAQTLVLDAGRVHSRTDREERAPLQAEAARESIRAGLDASFMEHATLEARFDAFCALDAETRMALVCYATSRVLAIGNPTSHDGDAFGAVLDAVQPDARALFRPTAKNHFRWLDAAALLALGVELFGEQFATEHRSTSKAVRVDSIARVFEADPATLGEHERKVRERWTPPSLRFGSVSDAPSPAEPGAQQSAIDATGEEGDDAAA